MQRESMGVMQATALDDLSSPTSRSRLPHFGLMATGEGRQRAQKPGSGVQGQAALYRTNPHMPGATASSDEHQRWRQ